MIWITAEKNAQACSVTFEISAKPHRHWLISTLSKGMSKHICCVQTLFFRLVESDYVPTLTGKKNKVAACMPVLQVAYHLGNVQKRLSFLRWAIIISNKTGRFTTPYTINQQPYINYIPTCLITNTPFMAWVHNIQQKNNN